ncbi:jg4606, partial [Pararge aegeria aegeria]
YEDIEEPDGTDDIGAPRCKSGDAAVLVDLRLGGQKDTTES